MWSTPSPQGERNDRTNDPVFCRDVPAVGGIDPAGTGEAEEMTNKETNNEGPPLDDSPVFVFLSLMIAIIITACVLIAKDQALAAAVMLTVAFVATAGTVTIAIVTSAWSKKP
jgi:hypothetical protein